MAGQGALIGTTALLALMGCGFWYLSADESDVAAITATIPGLSSGPTANGEQDAAASDEERLHAMAHQRAIMACLLAATYGAERGAKVKQAQALLDSLPPQLSSTGQADADAIRKLIPLNQKEKDASYALYFEGVSALARGDVNEVTKALDDVEGELGKAGLMRLIRYIKPVRAQIAAARKGGVPKDNYQRWIKDLENAVIAQN